MRIRTTEGRIFVTQGPWRTDQFDKNWPIWHHARDEHGQECDIVKSPFGLAWNDDMAFEQPCWRLLREVK
jgi:hypothetical protein